MDRRSAIRRFSAAFQGQKTPRPWGLRCSEALVMTGLALRLLLLVLCMVGISNASSAEPAGDMHKKVYLLRGLTNVLSPGIDQLGDALRRRNIKATVSNHVFWEQVADEAIADCRSGRVNVVVLAGHSFGASAALDIAEQMQQAGLR